MSQTKAELLAGRDSPLSFPSGNGTSGQYLQGDGSGGLSWQTLPAAGKILQVVQTVKTDTDTTTSQESYGDVTGMSVSIEPDKASSNILVQITLGRVGCSGQNRTTFFRIMRGTTPVAIGDAFSSAPVGTFATSDLSTAYSPGGVGFTFLDSPTYTLGDTLTYKLQWSGQNGDTHRLNANGNNGTGNDAPNVRCASTITVMEVAG